MLEYSTSSAPDRIPLAYFFVPQKPLGDDPRADAVADLAPFFCVFEDRGNEPRADMQHLVLHP
jgi:hypothetical protein